MSEWLNNPMPSDASQRNSLKCEKVLTMQKKRNLPSPSKALEHLWNSDILSSIRNREDIDFINKSKCFLFPDLMGVIDELQILGPNEKKGREYMIKTSHLIKVMDGDVWTLLHVVSTLNKEETLKVVQDTYRTIDTGEVPCDEERWGEGYIKSWDGDLQNEELWCEAATWIKSNY